MDASMKLLVYIAVYIVFNSEDGECAHWKSDNSINHYHDYHDYVPPQDIFPGRSFKADKEERKLINVSVSDEYKHLTHESFIGVTLSPKFLSGHHRSRFYSSERVQTLARGLAPCFLRVGGTMADFLIFNQSTSDPLQFSGLKSHGIMKRDIGDVLDKKDLKNFTMTVKIWDQLHNFTKNVRWNLIFDLNVLLRQNGRWDASNAVSLLKYTARKGYAVAGFELGNEPDDFPHRGYSVTASQLAQDFLQLQGVLKQFPSLHFSFVVGPDVTQLDKKKALRYLQEFLTAGANKAVDVTSFHHYYVNGRLAVLDQFMDRYILDGLIPEIVQFVKTTTELAPGRKAWLGETGSAWGGGAPGLSDRYVAGFMWLDKLGLSAKLGLDVVIRQIFYSGHYALVDKDFNPNPDYWLTLLYKRLVGNKVLDVTSSDKSGSFRMYAHCTNSHSSHDIKGSVTVYGMNLYNEAAYLTFPQYPNASVDTYLLEPAGSLTSSIVNLNGSPLYLTDDNKLPDLLPRKQSQPIKLPSKTFGFFVIPSAAAIAC